MSMCNPELNDCGETNNEVRTVNQVMPDMEGKGGGGEQHDFT